MFPHVVVFLPGIGGSVLRRDGRKIWSGDPSGLMHGVGGLLAQARAQPDPIVDLALGEGGTRQRDVGVVATEIVRGAGLVPGVAGVDFYRRFIDDLRDSCGLVRGLNFFEFPYDWRLDNRISAADLIERCLPWLRHYRQVSGFPDARLILIAHSMGGLVARYAVEVLGLWGSTHALITIGTPHRGSPKTAKFLVSGVPGLSWYGRLTTVIRSLPSVYQLLPVYPMVRLGGGGLVRFSDPQARHGLDQTRLDDGARFLHEIQEATRSNRQVDDYARKGVWLAAVVGTHQPTVGGLVVDSTGVMAVAAEAAEPGDGTVPMPAAHPIEWDYPETVMYAAGRHVSLTSMPAVRRHVIDLVRASVAARGLSQYRASDPPDSQLVLESPDVVLAGEPWELWASRATGTARGIDVSVTAVANERSVAGSPFVPDHTGRCVVPALPEGCYRVRASVSGCAAATVTDLLMVAPAA